jgi:hypothetical protein
MDANNAHSPSDAEKAPLAFVSGATASRTRGTARMCSTPALPEWSHATRPSLSEGAWEDPSPREEEDGDDDDDAHGAASISPITFASPKGWS